MRRTEKLLERLAVIERCVVLTGHEFHVSHLERARDIAEFGHALSALFRVVRRMREVARKHDEVGGLPQTVDRRDRLFERSLGVGILRGALEAPVRVRQLHEIKIIPGRGCCRSVRVGARHPYSASEARELQELPPVEFTHDASSLVNGRVPHVLHHAVPRGEAFYCS